MTEQPEPIMRICPVCGEKLNINHTYSHLCYKRYMSDLNARLTQMENNEGTDHKRWFFSILRY